MKKSERKGLSDLQPTPWNPRLIKDDRFKQLCKSLENDPEFMELRPVLATKSGDIYAGNMRYRAAEHLGWKEIPAIITDIDDTLAKERAVKDNNQFGEWDDTLSTLLDELEKEGVDLDTLGLDESIASAIDSLVPAFAPATLEEQGRLDEKKPILCPNCKYEFTT